MQAQTLAGCFAGDAAVNNQQAVGSAGSGGPEPSAPPAEAVLSPLEYAELFTLAGGANSVGGAIPSHSGRSAREIRKVLQLKDYARQMHDAVQQRIDIEVADARRYRQTGMSRLRDSHGADRQVQEQLHEIQGLIDEVSSVTSAEHGIWRYKKVWEPKLKYIQEDVERGLPEQEIADKYDLFDATQEAIAYNAAVTLRSKGSRQLAAAEAGIAAVRSQNSREGERLTECFESLRCKVEAAVAAELSLRRVDEEVLAKETALGELSARTEQAVQIFDGAQQREAVKEGLRPHIAEATGEVVHCKEARMRQYQEFQTLQSRNAGITAHLNTQLANYEAAQRGLALLAEWLLELQVAIHASEDPPPPDMLQQHIGTINGLIDAIPSYAFALQGVEAFEAEKALRSAPNTILDLEVALQAASDFFDVDTALIVRRLTELRSLRQEEAERVAEAQRREERLRAAEQRSRDRRAALSAVARVLLFALVACLLFLMAAAGVFLNMFSAYLLVLTEPSPQFYPVAAASPRSYFLWWEYSALAIGVLYILIISLRRSAGYWLWWMCDQIETGILHLAGFLALACAAVLLYLRHRIASFHVVPFTAVVVFSVSVVALAVLMRCFCCSRDLRSAFWPWVFWSLVPISVVLLSMATWRQGPFLLQCLVLLFGNIFFVAISSLGLLRLARFALTSFGNVDFAQHHPLCSLALCATLCLGIIVSFVSQRLPAGNHGGKDNHLVGIAVYVSFGVLVLEALLLHAAWRLGHTTCGNAWMQQAFHRNRRRGYDNRRRRLLLFQGDGDVFWQSQGPQLPVWALRVGATILAGFVVFLGLVVVDVDGLRRVSPIWVHLHGAYPEGFHTWRDWWCC